ncbi:TIGR03086 family metal-binding protein [Mycolicibacterium sp. XJ870]
MIDLTAACERTAQLLDGVRDEHLDDPTPCEELTVGQLVAHVGGLAVAFAAGARKDFGVLTDTPPGEDGYQLDDRWRTEYRRALADLAVAWQTTDAWDGMTRVGGVDLPGIVAGSVALTEVVIHGWDLAQATGQPYEVETGTAEAVLAQVSSLASDGPVEGLFGPAIVVPDSASAWERALGLSGRRGV